MSKMGPAANSNRQGRTSLPSHALPPFKPMHNNNTWQDVLRLDDAARMNTPGKAAGNWAWRLESEEIWDSLARESADLLSYATMCAGMGKPVPGHVVFGCCQGPQGWL